MLCKMFSIVKEVVNMLTNQITGFNRFRSNNPYKDISVFLTESISLIIQSNRRISIVFNQSAACIFRILSPSHTNYSIKRAVITPQATLCQLKNSENMKMFILKLSQVPNNFLSCWIQCNNSYFYTEMKPDKKNQIWVKDKRLAKEIRLDYQAFISSKLTLDKFFNRTILYGSYTREKEKIFIQCPDFEVRSVPIFLIRNRDKHIMTGWTVRDFQSRQAIKMKSEVICEMYKLPPISVNIDNPPDFVELYQINEG